MGNIPARLCSIEGCCSPSRALGLCNKHYKRKTRGSDMLAITARELGAGMTEIEWFWSKVKIVRDENSCWEWQGMKHKQGYGLFYQRGVGEVFAHRFAHQLESDLGTDDCHILHRCDNPPCVRPSHLFEGTHDDNMFDMAKKLRFNSGQGTKLDPEKVREIRHLLASSMSQQAIADLYGVGLMTINHVHKRRTWKHVE